MNDTIRMLEKLADPFLNGEHDIAGDHIPRFSVAVLEEAAKRACSDCARYGFPLLFSRGHIVSYLHASDGYNPTCPAGPIHDLIADIKKESA